MSHMKGVGCSGTASPRTSSRPLAMAEIFSFWAAARFSRKRALSGGLDVGEEQGHPGCGGQTTPCHTARPQRRPHAKAWRDQPPPSPAKSSVMPPRPGELRACAITAVPPSHLSPYRPGLALQTWSSTATLLQKQRNSGGCPGRGSWDPPAPPCQQGWSSEAFGWAPARGSTWLRHTHASTYSNLLKMGLAPCGEGASSSRLRENRG